MDTLDQHQKLAYDYIIDRIRDPASPRYFYIAGFAGTGKTHVMNALINTLSTNFKPLVLTWSGIAARQLTGGSTIMSFCGLTFDSSGLVGDNSYMRSHGDLKRRMVGYLRGERIFSDKSPVLFLDEVAALHDSVIDALSGALQELIPQSRHHLPFGGIPVILSGDVCQLGRVEFFEESAAYDMLHILLESIPPTHAGRVRLDKTCLLSGKAVLHQVQDGWRPRWKCVRS